MISTVLTDASSFPIRHQGPVYQGKVRSAYWLTPEDSRRLIEARGYQVHPDAALGVMIISDRISAFECNWRAEGGLGGVPGKGAALNAISYHWFDGFQRAGLASHHVLEVPHPLMWIVQKARPLKFEAIARQYITGSLWRAYERGQRYICGIELPEGLEKNQRLPELLFTPSTKGTLVGLEGVPEEEDAPISQEDILAYHKAFGLYRPEDLARASQLLQDGFAHVAQAYAKVGQILVDTKFEFGFVDDLSGHPKMIFMDEVGTPDSSRLWAQDAYGKGHFVEASKESFRSFLLQTLDRDILTDPSLMKARKALAASYEVPAEVFSRVSDIYTALATSVTGQPLPLHTRPHEELTEALDALGLLT